MKLLQEIWDNKIITGLAAAMISGAGYSVKLLNDASFSNGYNQAKSECLEEIRQLDSVHLVDLRDLTIARAELRECTDGYDL